MAVPKSLELWRFTPCDSALRCEQEWLRFYIHTLQHCLTNRGVILHNSRLPGRWLATSLIIISGMDRKLLYCCCLASCTLHSFWLLRHSIFTCMYAEIYDHPRKICASTETTNLQSWPGAVPWGWTFAYDVTKEEKWEHFRLMDPYRLPWLLSQQLWVQIERFWAGHACCIYSKPSVGLFIQC